MKVLKFGGTSMGDENSLQQVVSIIKKNQEQGVTQIVVCSAMSGVTNQLFEIGDLAENSEIEAATEIFKQIKKRHFEVASSFGVAETFALSIDPVFKDLENLIKGLALIHELSARSKAYLTGFGEKLSTRLLAEILKTELVLSQQLDSTFIKTKGLDSEEDEVDWDASKKSIKEALKPVIEKRIVPIVTGFFGTDNRGVLNLLGRGGSDFTAAILAVAMEIKVVEIWTDVDGFLSADPRIVPEAKVIDEMGFTEASELCFFGAKVLHPKTIRPVIDMGGEVWIKNTFKTEVLGTKLTKHVKEGCNSVVSITAKSVHVLALDVFGCNRNKREVFSDLFLLANQHGICIDMVASSEAVISFCIEDRMAENKAFLAAIKNVAPLEVKKDRKVICVVSPESVQGRIGVAADFFNAFAEERISLEMYSQNSSEVAQLMVVKSEDAERGIKAIHKKFMNSDFCSLK